ncbi:WD and tetratricopeptide repeats protein 1-like isoform X2 [Nilaparvata lugens]|uniref:WD and tetratricopeptide repeats protein 1-like isoform X2 n=2 Tax=Nilaparvata lugens TaxID=108931 RepID=UPI00193D410A|nr:WD and tetratricopeptide repeats protein 1-like isoform X2 [Nilaparvata lugens]XP_039288977.1 WD and tetratricopeptide repeats protein 1-like isoform X2 [Nilaparvata lugens]
MDNTNILRHLREREINDSINRSLRRKWHVSDSLINRLGHEKDLEGHEGCVNCLEWNSEGQILASASDDFQVILWNPFTYKKLQTIETGHHGNIFSVKFLPYSNDRILVTGAGDCQLLVHDVNERGPISICTCPMGRVKRLATSPNVPHIFWSAAEDGVIRQYDVRSPHYCSEGEPNVLVYLRSHLGASAEAKCVAINPCRSELMAVGANDPYVRLYDRRMIKLTCMRTPTVPQNPPPPRNGEITGSSRFTILTDVVMEVANNLSAGCVQYFVPGHLPIRNQYHKTKCMPATYVTFGPDGTDLLVNLGGEQIYLYDISQNSSPKSFNLPKYALPEVYGGCGKPLKNGRQQHAESAASKKHLPKDVENLKLSANIEFDRGEYSEAIRIYNTAILRFPDGPLLYANRAAAYMKRNWKGDMYAALRDCHTALAIDPNHVKAFFRLARCLYELDWREEAKQCLEAFKERFPGDATCHACKALQQDIDKPRSPIPKKYKNSSRQSTSDVPPDLQSEDDDEDDVELIAQNAITNQESAWREKAFDYKKRYYGHCNTTTDIKEANFFGSNGQYIMAGSDDGSIFFWERETTNNVRILIGDSSIVNCIQPHPSCCLLASSGIDSSVRLWSPKPQDGKTNDRLVGDIDHAAVMNQRRMKADPFDVVMRDMRSRLINQISQIEGAGEDALRSYDCRTS